MYIMRNRHYIIEKSRIRGLNKLYAINFCQTLNENMLTINEILI